MKNFAILGLALASITLMTGCKSKESAYRQAYEKAKAQQNVSTESNDEATTVVVNPSENTQQNVAVTPITPKNQNQHNDVAVRTIDGGVSVIAGNKLEAYSVVVGSFVTQANAEGLYNTLKNKGYAARVVKTNETINGHTGWFRVIASSYSDKGSAVQSRNDLLGTYAGAWLLYSK